MLKREPSPEITETSVDAHVSRSCTIFFTDPQKALCKTTCIKEKFNTPEIVNLFFGILRKNRGPMIAISQVD